MSLSSTHSALYGLIVAAVALVVCAQRPRKLPLPPGPPTIPLLGNIHKVPLSEAWLRLTELMGQFGDVIMFHGLGNHVLVLNTAEAMTELFEKRYSIYSDRPSLVMVGELMGANRNLPMKPYGSEWREQRKIARITLGSEAVAHYHSLMEGASLTLCQDIQKRPADFFDHIRLAAGRIILSATYGVEVESAHNEFIVDAEKLVEFFATNAVPGKHLCDMFPWMAYLPSWMPFKRYGRHGRALLDCAMYKPYNYVKEQLAAGTALPSVVQRLIEGSQDTMTKAWEDAILGCTVALYGAGSDTTFSTVLVFIMAMALHPEKQTKAQAELDALLGTHKLPSITDMDQLPYVNALIKEVMRWHPVVPLGVARCLKEEDNYAGYRLPKGTVVIPNVWALSRKPNLKYPPEDFIPERFLDPSQSVMDPSTWAFGFGRRICPGKLFAEKSTFAMIAHLLAFFSIEQVPGQPINLSFHPNGLTSPPHPFACSFKPRRSID